MKKNNRTIILTYKDLSEKVQEELYSEMSKIVIKELKAGKLVKDWKKITAGELDEIIMNRLSICKYEFNFR